MIRKEAIKFIAQTVGKSPIISANGYISRDLYEAKEKPSNFYMIGSMGLASSIGLGVALKKPKKRVFVFDGDGNILMNLGSLVTIGSSRAATTSGPDRTISHKAKKTYGWTRTVDCTCE